MLTRSPVVVPGPASEVDAKGSTRKTHFSAVMMDTAVWRRRLLDGDDDGGTGGPLAGDVCTRDIADSRWADITGAVEGAGHVAGETGHALWEQVIRSATMSELAARLAVFSVDKLPGFAAFFWTSKGMRSLVRGDVTVTDPSSRSVIATGSDIQTWSESSLGGLTCVSVITGEETESGPVLPLVVGVAYASWVCLDASADAQVTSPQVRDEEIEYVSPVSVAAPSISGSLLNEPGCLVGGPEWVVDGHGRIAMGSRWWVGCLGSATDELGWWFTAPSEAGAWSSLVRTRGVRTTTVRISSRSRPGRR